MKFATHANRGAAQALPTLSEFQEVEDMDAVLSRALIRPIEEPQDDYIPILDSHGAFMLIVLVLLAVWIAARWYLGV